MAPRPILKRSPSQNNQISSSTNVVHFPPSPSLTRTFAAYSASAYDRSPIVVAPNSCALPERGCPGRTYTINDSAPPSPTPPPRAFARDYHPRALAFAASRSRPADLSLVLPALIPDLSSESEESDSFAPTPAESSTSTTFGIHGLAGPSHPSMIQRSDATQYAADLNGYVSCDGPAGALAFLPYSPSASPPASPYQYEDSDEMPSQKPRRRPSPNRKHESSRTPDRIRTSPGSDARNLSASFSGLSFAPSTSQSPPTTPTKKSFRRRYLAPSQSSSFSTSPFKDDDCLGGF